VNSNGTGTTIQQGTVTSGPCSNYQVTLAFVVNSTSGNSASYSYTSAETTPTNIINSVAGSGESTKQ